MMDASVNITGCGGDGSGSGSLMGEPFSQLMMGSASSLSPSSLGTPTVPTSEIYSCPESVSDLILKYVTGSLLIFIIFMSIFGNVLVCIAIYTDRRLRKLGNLFLASLALADLFLASLVMTFAVANDMMGYWVFGAYFCELWISFDVMCCTASILNMCAICLDRFFHIKDPMTYERYMTKRVILGSVAGIWLLSGLVSFVPIGLGWHRPSEPEGEETIIILEPVDGSGYGAEPLTDSMGGEVGISSSSSSSSISSSDLIPLQPLPQCMMELTPIYASVSSAISFYIPCIIMIGLYTRLYLYAQKHVRNIRSMTKWEEPPAPQGGAGSRHPSGGVPASGTPPSAGPPGGHKADTHHLHKNHASEHKAAITLGVIMGVFLFCWVPFFIVNIIGAFCKTCIPVLLFKVLTWLGYFNSAMNPVIYSIFNTEFREAFRRILMSYVRNECCDRGGGGSGNLRSGGGGGTHRAASHPNQDTSFLERGGGGGGEATRPKNPSISSKSDKGRNCLLKETSAILPTSDYRTSRESVQLDIGNGPAVLQDIQMTFIPVPNDDDAPSKELAT